MMSEYQFKKGDRAVVINGSCTGQLLEVVSVTGHSVRGALVGGLISPGAEVTFLDGMLRLQVAAPDIDIPQANGIKINVCGHGVVHIVLFDEADAPIAVGSLPRAMFDKIAGALDDVAAERAEDKPAIEIPHGTIH